MKKMVFIAFALMIVATSAAMAGTNLAWTDCLGGTPTANNRVVACANTGSIGNLFISFVLPADLPLVTASDCFTDVQTGNSVSSWWFTNPAGTRWAHAAGSGGCPGWFDLATSGPIAFAPTAVQTSPSRIRVRTSIVVAAGEEQNLTGGTEYISGQLTLKNGPAPAGVPGTAANTECMAGGAIGIVHFELTQPGPIITTMETTEVNNCDTFRGGSGPACPGATPTKKATWGSIKALYR